MFVNGFIFYLQSNNRLEKIENLEGLRFLQSIKLAGNAIRSLSGLQDHGFLEVIEMEGNEVNSCTPHYFIML